MLSSLAPFALAAGFALQPTGSFHGDEPVARDGEQWLALIPRADGAQALVATRADVRRVLDHLLDGPDGPPTGLEVEARDAPGAPMLLRGPGLRAGPVEAARILEPAGGAPVTDIATFVFRGATWRLRAACPEPPAAIGEARSCDLLLEQGLARQVLLRMAISRQSDGTLAFGDAAGPALLHAGDFDRDGRPDLILETTDHYNVLQPALYLSGAARGGELVRRVADHRSVGC